MLNLMLEPTDDRANPSFRDAASCRQWLAKLQLTNIQVAHSLLLTEVNEFNRLPLHGHERLNTLELLRDTVHYVQEEYARKLIAKAIPLNEHDLTNFFAILQLWHAMSLGYQRCLQALIDGDKQLNKQGAMLCQRALQYVGLAIFQHLRTGYEVDGKLWQQLHSFFSFAESRKLLSEKVTDPLNKVEPRGTCQGTYLRILLIANTHLDELSRIQLNMLDYWLARWADLLNVARSYTSSKGDAPPLAFDLDGSPQGLQLAKKVKPGESVRYLAMVPLSKQIRVKTILLQQGKKPVQADLGEFDDSRACIELLTLLHQSWCEDQDMRYVARINSERHTQLCQKFTNIHSLLNGKLPQQPVASAQDNAEARKQIETFGRVLQESPAQKPANVVTVLEDWRVDNENIQGAQLTRESTTGCQLSRRQLVASRSEEGETLVLGVVAWLKVMRSGQLRIGLRYFPGSVEPVSINATGSDKTELSSAATAFLLHAVPELNIQPSLIVPHAWFKPDRLIEMAGSKSEKQDLKIGFCLEHGSDFDRVSFKQN